jgi:hypothetical protein
VYIPERFLGSKKASFTTPLPADLCFIETFSDFFFLSFLVSVVVEAEVG